MITASALIGAFKQALKDDWGYIWGTAGVKWTQARQNDLNKTTDSDRANGRKYGAKWIGHMVADCSGLFTWAFKQLGGYMYHGSDTMYRKYCVNKGELKSGKRTDGATLKPGSAVFCWNGTKYSHVGLFIGDGLVIEAAGTQQGVITTKLTATKWKFWGELTGVDYGTAPAPAPVDPGEQLPTLRKGDKGQYVTLLQTKLKNKGYDLGRYGVDGDFGSATLAAVKAFQGDNGLTVDGVVGKKTWEALEKDTQAVFYSVVIPHKTAQQADQIIALYAGAFKEIEKG